MTRPRGAFGEPDGDNGGARPARAPTHHEPAVGADEQVFLFVFSHGDPAPDPPARRRRGRVRYDRRRGRGGTGEAR